jgi:hypothetical protein
MKRCIAFVVVFFFLSQAASAEVIGAMDDMYLEYSDAPRTASVDAYVQLTNGSTLDADSWQALVNLTGPDDKVQITGCSMTSPPHPSLIADSTPFGELIGNQLTATDSTLDNVPVTDGAGLMKIELDIEGGAFGSYALNFDDSNSFLTFSPIGGVTTTTSFDGFSGGAIVIIPEPSAFALCGIFLLLLLARRRVYP